MTGFADEAAKDIAKQIKATKELGWENIECRNVDGVNIHDMDDDKFEAVYAALQESGVKINCFGSAIANWGKHIDKPMTADIESLNRAIPRMQRLGTKYIRIMSYAVLPDRSPEDQMKEERFERLRIITDRLLSAGIQPLHENCMNFGGMGWSYTLELIDNVPGLKLVFDTGNPVFTDDRTKEPPYPKQSSLEFYRAVKKYVEYVHIKDAVIDPNGNTVYTYPGEGNGNVREIVADLISSGYDGGFSIEPHLASVFHDADVAVKEEKMYSTYVEYGKRMMKIIDDIKSAKSI